VSIMVTIFHSSLKHTNEAALTVSSIFILVRSSAPAREQRLRLIYVLPIKNALSFSLNQTPQSPSISHFHQSARPRELCACLMKTEETFGL
jgi:hypothetical protein